MDDTRLGLQELETHPVSQADLSETAAASAPAPACSSLDDEEVSIVLTTSLGHFLCHLGELIFPNVMVAVMTQLVLEKNQVTWLPFLGYMLMGVGALPVGIWADAWNPRKILFLYFVLLAVGGLAVAAATNALLLCIALTLLGLALSIYHPVGLAMISLGVRARGRALGINGVAGSLGLAMSPLLAATGLALGSWRYAYLAFAALSATCAVAFYFSKHGVSRAVAEPPRAAPVALTEQPAKRHMLLPLALLMIVMTLGGLNYRSLVTTLPPFFLGDRTAQHSTGSNTTVFTFVILLAGGIGQILGGWLADRFGARRVYGFLVFMLIPLSVAIALAGGTLLGAMFACCLAVGMFGQQPVENALLADYTTKARRSRSYALKFVMTFGIGSFGAILVGQIWHWTNSLNAVFFMLAGSGVVMMLLLGLFLVQTVAARPQA